MKSTYGALFAALLCAGQASAVSLSARCQGQILIYPYYTTVSSNTLISLAHNAREAKMVRLRVAEGEPTTSMPMPVPGCWPISRSPCP